MAEREAATVEELYRISGHFPEPERSQAQDLAAPYARVVVEEEWPMMREGRRASSRGISLMSCGRASRTSSPTRRPGRSSGPRG
jgi:hypothetical protein